MEPMEGKTERALDLNTVLTKLHRIAELAVTIDQQVRGGSPPRSESVCPKSRMREFCTSGSEGGLGG